MNASTELVTSVLDALDTLGSPDELIDIVSRAIILEIAKANANGHPVRETDIVSKLSHISHLAVHYRLKSLVETDLVTNTRNPADRRERLLYLTPLAQEKLGMLAQEIRQLREK
jgi:DNA-binding HxlR family transcriptional regulator